MYKYFIKWLIIQFSRIDNSRSLEILLDSENDENSTNKENDFKIKSPFKTNNKTQMKLTKMLNYANTKQTNAIKEQSPASVDIVEIKKTEKIKTQNSIETESVPKVTWKIKATVDNRNFLIPIS
jgi:hypothetical protein